MRRFLLLLIAVTMAACAPRLQPALPDIDPPRLTETAFIAADGKALTIQRWAPAGDAAPRAIFVAVHGFNDYANAFDSSGDFFAGHGILTIAYDQRGFGRDPDAGIWAGGERMAGDLRQMLALVRLQYPDIPLYVLAQSMGGAVALMALSGEGADRIADGAILVAPAVWGWSSMNIFYQASLWLSAHVRPGWKLTGQSLDIMPSDNIEMLRAQGRDPLVIKETRVDSIYGLVTLMDDALKVAPDVRLPLLLLYGEKDEVIPARPLAKLRERLGAHEYRFYPDSYHMMLRDLHPEGVFDDVLEFIEMDRGVADKPATSATAGN